MEVVETVKSSRKMRIAAIMSVYDSSERFNVQLEHAKGWLGATATGDFGKVEGWIRVDATGTLPASLADLNVKRQTNLWGRSRDGETFLT